MLQFVKFIPFAKVDEAKREVYGLVTSPALDADAERCHYESTKPLYKKWSASVMKASGGKSMGNIREMHQASAVGKAEAIEFYDDKQQIWMKAKIVDDDAWKKCAVGVYNGFSHGGRYLKVWEENGETWYTAQPVEVSVVDMPNNPDALFEYVKADGATEMRKFVHSAQKMKKGMYEVARLASLLQDLQYLQQCSEGERNFEGDTSTMPEDLKSWLTDGVELLVDMVSEEGAELTGKAGSGDDKMAEKEKVAASGELEKKDEKKVEKKDDLEKARHSKATMESLNAIKEHHGKIGKALKAIAGHHETISDCAKSMGEHLDKVLTGAPGQEQTGSNADVKGDDDEDEPHPGNQKKAAETGDLAKVVAELAEVVKAMKDQPAERKAVARVVTKSEDADDRKDEEKVTKVTPITTASGDRDISTEDKSKLFKSIYSNPMADAPLAGRKAV